MRMKKWAEKVIAGLVLIITIVTCFTFPGLALANENTNSEEREKLLTIERVNPELTMNDITLMIKEYASLEGITESESLESFYREALTQQLEQESNGYSLNKFSKPNGAPGTSRHKGDVMYSVAWTGINHGHSAIYYTTTTVVHAPGPGNVSRAENAHNNIGIQGGMRLQFVNISQIKRDTAAYYAYNYLRDKPYDLNFAFNKTTTSKLNCSGLVWNAYLITAGIDLDCNGGPGVYPSDIRDSPYTITYAYR